MRHRGSWPALLMALSSLLLQAQQMNFDDWVPDAESRMEEAGRAAASRPEIEAEFKKFIFCVNGALMAKNVKMCEQALLGNPCVNPVSDVVDFRDLAKTLDKTYWNSDSRQRDLFFSRRWLRKSGVRC